MSKVDDKLLTQYLQKVFHIQESSRETLQKKDFVRAANELGIHKEDWKVIETEFELHLQKGLGFHKYRNWDDAIKELEEAYSINPFHEEVLLILASSYAGRFREYDIICDCDEAILAAQKCLEINPKNERAYQIISSLKRERARTKMIERDTIKTLVVAIALGIMVFAGLAYFSLVNSSAFYGSNEINYEQQVTPKISKVPVELFENDFVSSRNILRQESYFVNEGVYSEYTLKSIIWFNENPKDTYEIDIYFLDNDGQVIFHDNKTQEADYRARKGDNVKVHLDLQRVFKTNELQGLKTVKIFINKV